MAPEWEGKGGRLPTGYPEVDDLLCGGLPRGRLSELVGRGAFGAARLAQRLLAGVTAEANFAAWVDVADTFDPASASAAGIALHRLLWVRPPDLVAAFAATEILLATGGFALVLLDTAGGYGVSERQGARGGRGAPGGQGERSAQGRRGATARRHTGGQTSGGKTSGWQAGPQKGRRMLTAPQTWLRLARAAEQSRTALVVLPGSHGPHGSNAPVGSGGLTGAAAGVRLELSSGEAVWEGAPGAPSLLEGLVSQVDVTRNRGPEALHSNHSRSRQARIRLA